MKPARSEASASARLILGANHLPSIVVSIQPMGVRSAMNPPASLDEGHADQ